MIVLYETMRYVHLFSLFSTKLEKKRSNSGFTLTDSIEPSLFGNSRLLLLGQFQHPISLSPSLVQFFAVPSQGAVALFSP
jgi:hypothetical protein